MKNTVSFIFAVLLFIAACNSSDDKADRKAKDKYEQTKETLEETEKKNPKRFLTVKGNDKKNLIGQTGD